MVQLGSLRAWIEVGNEPRKEAEEYKLEIAEDGKEAACWIESQVGQSFCVVWQETTDNRSVVMEGRLHVDGTACGGKLLRPQRKALRVEHSGVRISTTTMRPYVFAELQLTDDDALMDASSPHLGEIALSIIEVEVSSLPKTYVASIPENGKVHERAKKSGTHRVGFGNPISIPSNTNIAKTKDIKSLAKFIFRYQSFPVLQANGIVPSSETAPVKFFSSTSNTKTETTPPPPPVKREAVKPEYSSDGDGSVADVEDSDAERLATLKAEIEAIQAKRDAKKRDSRKPKRVKTEESKDVKPVFIPGEVIDLT